MENKEVSTNRWNHRRRMAYIAIASMSAVMGVILSPWVTEARIDSLSAIISTFFFVMSAIVGAYVGFATVDDKWKKE